MTAQEKAHVLAMVAASPLSVREVLRSLGIAEATYYRWKRRLQMRSDGLKDRPGGARRSALCQISQPGGASGGAAQSCRAVPLSDGIGRRAWPG